MAKAAITIKFSDESREALERFTAALADVQERTAALLPTLCDDGQHVWTAEVCSLVEECAQCMTTRHKSGLDPEPESVTVTRSRATALAAAAALEAAIHMVDDDESAQTLARMADQWRAEADEYPESESVTVTLPRDVVSLAWARLDVAARACGGDTGIADRHAFARDALADALDAASAPQEADQ